VISGKVSSGVFFKFEPLARWAVGYVEKQKERQQLGDGPIGEDIHKPTRSQRTRTITDTGLNGHWSKKFV